MDFGNDCWEFFPSIELGVWGAIFILMTRPKGLANLHGFMMKEVEKWSVANLQKSFPESEDWTRDDNLDSILIGRLGFEIVIL